ncbi:acetyl-CoA synthetase-like protein [Vararia minispora EC-137]|uniref:Acetyl-CoA synthetase-like protein n=1 Tax=Vararia minispora EC-137 TaxID=1314806 RepID=A0ACB8Q958_9AGAM|nr:acetyl-CoA synthetase-like protein [Vararia minispora EC-137]
MPSFAELGFTQPPLDGSLTTPELYRFHAKHNPHYPVYEYPGEGELVHTIHYREAYNAILRAARLVHGHFLSAKLRYDEKSAQMTTFERPVLAILAVADSISYMTLIGGIMCSGMSPFPLSPRNSAAAVAHLLKTSGVLQVVVTPDPAMQALASETVAILTKQGIQIEVLPMPAFEDLFHEDPPPEESSVRVCELRRDMTVLLVHSSGTTSFPRIVRFRSHNFVGWGLPFENDVRLCGLRLGIHSVPIFHTMGLIAFVWPLSAGAVMGCFKPKSPPVLPTADAVLAGAYATRTDIVYVVPSFIEEWAKTSFQLVKLRKFMGVMYAGAPLDKSVGDRLVEMGVRLTVIYASTEAGCLNRFLSSPTVKDWEFFQLASHFKLGRVPQQGQPGVFEPVIYPSERWSPNVLNVISDGCSGYSTGDLLLEHPIHKGYYQIFGRADEQLVLATGEKAKNILRGHPLVANAVFFGSGRFNNGVLIQPQEPLDLHNTAAVTRFKNQIWPTVMKMNDFAPKHSRVFKGMIIVTTPEKPLEFTPKGNPRRSVCLRAYETEINELYLTASNMTEDSVLPPSSWSAENTRIFVKAIVRTVTNTDLPEDMDLFQHGCDSLHAIWIRNRIVRALRTATNIPPHEAPMNFVYAHPSIVALSAFVHKLASGNMSPNDMRPAVETETSAMCALVDKYGNFDQLSKVIGESPQGVRQKETRVVLLTGSTGRLGCHLLAQFVAAPDVSRVFAVNRGNDQQCDALKRRQLDALQACGVEISKSNLDKIVFVVCDLAKDRLGLCEDIYSELISSLTNVVLNAWLVDFNANLSSYESLVRGVRSTLELAAQSVRNPSVLFVSSVNSLQTHDEAIREVSHGDPHVALGTGYGESKWIAEQIVLRAAATLGLRANVVRVGQLTGDTVHGIWNTKELVPKIVRLCSRFVGAVPSKDDVVSWIPVDIAAVALCEMTSSSEPIMHLSSPTPISWNAVFAVFAEVLGIPLIAHTEWVERLRDAVEEVTLRGKVDAEDAQTLSLVNFTLREEFWRPTQALDTRVAQQVSPTLAQAGGFREEHARKAVTRWKANGFV